MTPDPPRVRALLAGRTPARPRAHPPARPPPRTRGWRLRPGAGSAGTATATASGAMAPRVIDEDTERGIQYVAEPIGVVLALLPITNPTSTALFKAIVAAKTRTSAVADFESICAVIVAVPAPFAATRPPPTVATVGALDCQLGSRNSTRPAESLAVTRRTAVAAL